MLVARYTNTNWEDYYNIARWRSFYIWLLKLQLVRFGENDVYLNREEFIQYGYRFAKCYDCLIAGKCKDCGCDAEGRFNSTTDMCSAGKWGPFVDKDIINDYFNNPNLEFNIKVTENVNNNAS